MLSYVTAAGELTAPTNAAIECPGMSGHNKMDTCPNVAHGAREYRGRDGAASDRRAATTVLAAGTTLRDERVDATNKLGP